MKRVGILGGAFNPPHLGHLRLAELALVALELDEVRFIPTEKSPHKAPTLDGPGSAARMVLLEAALAETRLPFRADALELERGGTSYTVDTLEALHQREPETSWILLMGSDQLPGLPGWYRLERILELASIAIAPRPGHDMERPTGFADRQVSRWSGKPGELIWLPGTELDLASSRLRENLRTGGNQQGLSTQVAAVISRENYYR